MKIIRLAAVLAILVGGVFAAVQAQTASEGYVAPGVRIPPPRITWRASPASVSISDIGLGNDVEASAANNMPVPVGISASAPTSIPSSVGVGTSANVTFSPPFNVAPNTPVSADANSYYAPPASQHKEPRVLDAAASKHVAEAAQGGPCDRCEINSGTSSGSPCAKCDTKGKPSCDTTKKSCDTKDKSCDTKANSCDTKCNSCDTSGKSCDSNCKPQCDTACKTSCESKCDCDTKDECKHDCDCQCETCKKCGHRRGCWCALECPDEKPACKLFDCCCLKQHNLDIGGYAELGYTYNAYQPTDRWNGVVGFNDRDEFQGNQLGVHIEKVTKPDECSCDLGGRIDAIFGSDSRWFQALGLETHDDGTNKWNGERFYQLALPQMYAQLSSQKASVKVGKFVTPFEYEVIDPTGNFFYSHSYGFTYAGPFTQTGVYATFNLGDNWTVGGGFDRGWDRFEDDNGQLGYFATLGWTSTDKNSSIMLVGLTGKEIGLTGINANRTAASVVITEKFNPRFTYVGVGDYGIQQQGADGGNGDAEWYGIELYVFYQMCCKWWLGARFEWFRDDDGTRVFPVGDGSTQGVNSNPASVGGFAGNFYEVAVGLNYKPSPNFWIRPEIRYDRFNGVAENGEQPFDDGTRDTQVLAACDIIMKF
jgi:hypothetical protein